MSSDDTRVWSGMQTIAEREAPILAPYAMHSVDSKGREHDEQEHRYRGPYQRDRDRVLHSTAYRRLSYKTQVFTGEMGDYHRTRLTHTMEVASIARTIGRALRLNEDLVEALALLHDIGHPPYGHAGEDTLDECLSDAGGFSHNEFAMSLVRHLEVRFHEFPGLNLTQEVLESQQYRIDKSSPAAAPLLETQVVDAADSITYDAHDTDDAVALRLVPLDELLQNQLISEADRRVRRSSSALDAEARRRAIVHEMINWQVSDALRESVKSLQAAAPADAQDARKCGISIGPGSELAEMKRELESFLFERVYRHRDVIRVRGVAQQQLREMYAGFVDRSDLLPQKFQDRAESVGLPRAVGEYLAGMTDRFCGQQFERYFAVPSTGGFSAGGQLLE